MLGLVLSLCFCFPNGKQMSIEIFSRSTFCGMCVDMYKRNRAIIQKVILFVLGKEISRYISKTRTNISIRKTFNDLFYERQSFEIRNSFSIHHKVYVN